MNTLLAVVWSALAWHCLHHKDGSKDFPQRQRCFSQFPTGIGKSLVNHRTHCGSPRGSDERPASAVASIRSIKLLPRGSERDRRFVQPSFINVSCVSGFKQASCSSQRCSEVFLTHWSFFFFHKKNDRSCTEKSYFVFHLLSGKCRANTWFFLLYRLSKHECDKAQTNTVRFSG